MATLVQIQDFRARFIVALCAAALVASLALPARAQVTPMMQGIAEAAASDDEVASYYKSVAYAPLWTGNTPEHRARRAALLMALQSAGDHALPVGSYNLELLFANLRDVSSERDLGTIEVALSKTYLDYARDLQTGVLTPSKIDPGLVRKVPLRDRTELLQGIAGDVPAQFLKSLAPTAPEYARLLKAKMQLKRQQARGGWGPAVPASSLKPGDRGPSVVALRNRMIAMGYMTRSASLSYDAALQKAVQQFQYAHGLETDGVAGSSTMREINKQIEDRLPSVLVAIERERWINMERGKRHVWVNLTDFSATIVDDGRETFRTRSVIGHTDADRRSPEFSDVMEYMEINPYWNVPRSISVGEYLPRMISTGGGAARHLQLIDGRGRVVSRSAVNWGAYSPRSFPFDLRQAPGNGNALGLVKFMFPNRYNIYLHDTPAKSLFSREVRAFSHGCVRLNDPFDFAYALLAKQEADPVGFFQTRLKSGQNTRVNLVEQVPVHLVYRTAFTSAKGALNFRGDVYGRDAKIYDALLRAGVVPGAVGG